MNSEARRMVLNATPAHVSGRLWTPCPLFRKQQAVGSNPTAGSLANPEFKRLRGIRLEAALPCLTLDDNNADNNRHKESAVLTPEEALHCCGGVALHVGQDVRIEVHRDGHAGVPEHL